MTSSKSGAASRSSCDASNARLNTRMSSNIPWKPLPTAIHPLSGRFTERAGRAVTLRKFSKSKSGTGAEERGRAWAGEILVSIAKVTDSDSRFCEHTNIVTEQNNSGAAKNFHLSLSSHILDKWNRTAPGLTSRGAKCAGECSVPTRTFHRPTKHSRM